MDEQKYVFETISQSSINKSKSLIMLYYGGMGTGKTWFGGTAGNKTLFLDMGQGLDTLDSLDFKRLVGTNPSKISIREAKISKVGIIEGGKFTLVDAMCDIIDQALKHNSSDFDTFVVDEMSAFGISLKYKAMEFNKVLKNMDSIKKAQDGKVLPGPEMNDYQTEMNLMQWFFKQTYIPIFKELGKNLLVLAHEKTVYGKADKMGEMAKVLKIMPAISGEKQFAHDIFPSYFDEVWRVEAVGRAPSIKYRAHTAKNELWSAKTRNGGVINYVEENPNFLDIVKRIKNKTPIPNP